MVLARADLSGCKASYDARLQATAMDVGVPELLPAQKPRLCCPPVSDKSPHVTPLLLLALLSVQWGTYKMYTRGIC